MQPMTTSRIVCIRHGESTFNAHHKATGRDPGHIDARLSELGHRQAMAAREAMRKIPFELVVTSPLTRAIQTTMGMFEDHPAKPRLLVEVLHRECQESSCDVGRAASVLAKEFPGFDVGHLPEIWWHDADQIQARGWPVEPPHLFDARVAGFRDWLRARPETTIAVVGHSTFFYHLTGQWLANCEAIEIDLDVEPRLRAYA